MRLAFVESIAAASIYYVAPIEASSAMQNSLKRHSRSDIGRAPPKPSSQKLQQQLRLAYTFSQLSSEYSHDTQRNQILYKGLSYD